MNSLDQSHCTKNNTCMMNFVSKPFFIRKIEKICGKIGAT